MAGNALMLEVTEQDDTVSDELAEIVDGLTQAQKTLSPKFFYDETGSRLFDTITELPEYYPTATELSIMRANIREIVTRIGPEASIIEFGSGSSTKTRLLLEYAIELAAYVPVDISREHLLATANSLAADFPELDILPVAADFTHPFPLPQPTVMPVRNIVYFPGSTIGNFSRDEALSLLTVMHQIAGEDGALLIGVDLQKETAVVEAAYNDSQGVTAQFNLNVLHRLNREFGADFDVDAFAHVAFYNEDHGRIEMHLQSLQEQTVTIGNKRIHLDTRETIHTENSHKFTLDGFRELAAKAGFDVGTVWTDRRQYFSLQYCLRK